MGCWAAVSRPMRPPQWVFQGVYITTCAGDTAPRLSSDLTITRLQENSCLLKPLNQHDLFEPGTHLAAIRDKDIRMRQHGPEAPMKSILDHSFRYTKSIDTDLRKTFARIRREQRQQARAPVAGDNPGKVFPIRQHKHAAVS